MGLFDKIFKSEKEADREEVVRVPWNQLTTMEALDEIEEISFKHPVAILKHSTRCGISRMVLRQFEQSYSLKGDEVKLYFLDLLNYREISNKIASKFNVPHESPQLIVIREGKAIYDASHNEISSEKLKDLVA
ncbi:bacillithiol system redox-active protein YtxJ [Gillisia sp. M10.2A]|uniref:Bacillithiol system redox-active protein YtxJ n=2 Tax=Gillisia lutea TaxID=2909668 RepID=A0ABS9EEG6_9FLAO|nr:bacillithiol system redox-active protein YtxJ [Gillisia lutea]